MPNHFHFLINTKKDIKSELFSESLRIMLSSFTRAINKQEGRSGSLFQQNSKAKLIPKNDSEYPFICFQYIHQNPIKADLVKQMEDWEFSSFKDYLGLRNGTLCNQTLAHELLDLPKSKEGFYDQPYQVVRSDISDSFY